MRSYVELGLTAILIIVIYKSPSFLVSMVHSTLGKLVAIITVGLLAKHCGLNAGLLAAITMIVLLETNKEGFENSREELIKGVKIGSSSNKNIGCDEGGCKKDTECAACKKIYPNKIDNEGNPARCNCKSTCTNSTCKCECLDNTKANENALQHAPTQIERFSNINNETNPAQAFVETGTDQIGLSRMLKMTALYAKNAASQQANGQTNNGGGIAI